MSSLPDSIGYFVVSSCPVRVAYSNGSPSAAKTSQLAVYSEMFATKDAANRKAKELAKAVPGAHVYVSTPVRGFIFEKPAAAAALRTAVYNIDQDDYDDGEPQYDDEYCCEQDDSPDSY